MNLRPRYTGRRVDLRIALIFVGLTTVFAIIGADAAAGMCSAFAIIELVEWLHGKPVPENDESPPPS